MSNKKETGSAATETPSVVETNQHYFIPREVLRQVHDLAYDIMNLTVDSKYCYSFEFTSYLVSFSVFDTDSREFVTNINAYQWEKEKFDELFAAMESELEAIRSAR